MKINSRSTGAVLMGALLWAVHAASAEPPKPSPLPAAAPNAGLPTYDNSFRLVHTRNVFDPDRRPVRPPGASTPAPVAPTRADYVALTGTAVEAEKSLAFFSGSRSEYNVVIPVNSKVGGATITKINPNEVEVERNGRRLVVAVGQTIPLDDKSTPAPAPASQPAAASTVSSTASAAPGTTGSAAPATTSPSAGSPPPAANLEEIRRRMMERHNQDQK